MSVNLRKGKGRSDVGGYGGLPKVVWRHPDYQSLSGNAVKLLMDFACQYNGRNNGNLTAAFAVLSDRGWNSRTTLQKALNELLSANFLMRTREGRFANPGAKCALYAITWKSIDECPGKELDVGPTITAPRKFSLEKNKSPSPETGQGSVQKLDNVRPRDERGRYVSVQEVVRLRAVT